MASPVRDGGWESAAAWSGRSNLHFRRGFPAAGGNTMFRRFLLSVVAAVGLSATFACLPHPQAVSQQMHARGLDTTKHPQARKTVAQSPGFPKLREFEVVDPTVGMKYNCIAHSLGIHSYWVNPKTGPAGQPLVHMDRMYKEKGYTRVSGLDFRLGPGVKKVAVYAKVRDGRIHEVTHAALQTTDGTWTSKLGQLPLIRHRIPQDLSGPSYGQPVAVYVKRG